MDKIKIKNKNKIRLICLVVSIGLVLKMNKRLAVNLDDENLYQLQQGTLPESLPYSFLSNYSLDYASCTNKQFPDNWCLDDQKIPRYVGNKAWPPRMVEHYTHKGYEKCLAEKTVVLIGDSRVRHQFMNLAAFLKNERFMKCNDYASTIDPSIVPDPECFLIDARGLEWPEWFRRSTNYLASDTSSADQYQQSSLCDCFRGRPFKPEESFENRYIKRSTTFGEVNLIYMQNFINRINMDEQYPPFAPYFSAQDRCKTSYCGIGNRTDAFEGDITATMWEILPKLNATHVFLNIGWEHLFDFEKQSELSCNIRDFEKEHPHIKVYLLSHPHDHFSSSSQFDPSQLRCDSNVLDRTVMTYGIPEAINWYRDNLHVRSIINEEFNHQLVEKICPI